MPDTDSAQSTPRKHKGSAQNRAGASKESTRAATAGTRKDDPEAQIDLDDVEAKLSPLKLSQQARTTKLKKVPE